MQLILAVAVLLVAAPATATLEDTWMTSTPGEPLEGESITLHFFTPFGCDTDFKLQTVQIDVAIEVVAVIEDDCVAVPSIERVDAPIGPLAEGTHDVHYTLYPEGFPDFATILDFQLQVGPPAMLVVPTLAPPAQLILILIVLLVGIWSLNRLRDAA